MALEWIPGAIQGVGSMASGVLNWLSGHETNETNKQMSAEDRLWNWATQQQQNAFNKEMVDSQNRENRALIEEARQYNAMREDTAYQRQVSDMSKAGLNPLSQFNSPSVNPTPVAQNQAFQGNAPTAHRSTPFVAPQMDISFDGIANAMIRQTELNQKQQQIDLASIMAGVDPSHLKSGNTNKIIDLYSGMLDAQLKNLRKEADSPYVRNEPGSLSFLRGVINYGDNLLKDIKEGQSDSLIVDSLVKGVKGTVEKVENNSNTGNKNKTENNNQPQNNNKPQNNKKNTGGRKIHDFLKNKLSDFIKGMFGK